MWTGSGKAENTAATFGSNLAQGFKTLSLPEPLAQGAPFSWRLALFSQSWRTIAKTAFHVPESLRKGLWDETAYSNRRGQTFNRLPREVFDT